LSHSASQRRVFACGSRVLCDHMFVVFTLAESKNDKQEKSKYHSAKAQSANCVSPTTICNLQCSLACSLVQHLVPTIARALRDHTVAQPALLVGQNIAAAGYLFIRPRLN
jgi:hypothetical protein